MVKALNAVVVDRAMVRPGRLVKVAGVVITDRHPVAINADVFRPDRQAFSTACSAARRWHTAAVQQWHVSEAHTALAAAS
jgi:hypothetical protein